MPSIPGDGTVVTAEQIAQLPPVVPGHVCALWRFVDRDLPYVKGTFIPSSLELNIPPG